MYQDTITLFNRKSGDRFQGNVWLPTVIEGVNLNIDRAAILEKYGEASQDSATLHIRFFTKDGVPMIRCADGVEKPWRSPKEWDQAENSITFSSGSDFDFFWKGRWDGGIVSDSDYGDEGFYNYMNREHDYVFAISAVAQYSVIPHFEIMGK